jgi:AsmA protein
MKRKAVYIVGALVGIILLVLILLPVIFDANRYRGEIQSRLSQSLGRAVTIGNLKLSIFSGGIKADDISIAEDPAFGKTPFIQAKSLSVGVELMPLLFNKQIHVESLVLNEPVVRLLQSSGGKWNFSTLGQKQKASRGSSGTSSDLEVKKLEVSNGKLELGNAEGKTQTYSDVELTVKNLSYSSSFPYELSAKAPGDGKLAINGTAGPIDRNDASRTPFTGDVDIQNLDLAATGFMGSDSGLGGVLDYKGKVISDGRKLTSDGTAKATKLRLVKAGTAATQPVEVEYHSEYDLARDQGTIEKTNIKTGKSVAHLAGTYGKRGASTDLDLKLTGEGLSVQDLEGLLPAMGVVLPPGSSLQGGTASANLNLRGPAEKLVTTGNVDIANARLAGFSLGQGLSSVAALAGIRSGSDTTIQKFASNLRIAPEGTHLDNVDLVVPELGTITGNGTIGANGALDFHLVAKLANGGGAVGALTQLTGLKGGLKSIPVAVKGTTAKPVFVPDLGSAVAGSAIPSNLGGAQGQQNPIGGILGGIFGGKKPKQ